MWNEAIACFVDCQAWTTSNTKEIVNCQFPLLTTNSISLCVPLRQASLSDLCQYSVVSLSPIPLSKGVTRNLKKKIVLQGINVWFYLQVRTVRCKLFKITQKPLKIAARIALDLHENQGTSLSRAWNLKETHKREVNSFDLSLGTGKKIKSDQSSNTHSPCSSYGSCYFFLLFIT